MFGFLPPSPEGGREWLKNVFVVGEQFPAQY